MASPERLSDLIAAELERRGLKAGPASRLMGQPENFLSRILKGTGWPGPAKYKALAEFLGITEYEVGGALALDQLDKLERDEIAAQAARRPR